MVIPLLSRTGAIVARPHATWLAIAREHTSPLGLYFGYVVPLAAIGPLATFVALHLVGTRISRTELYHASVGEASAAAVVSFVYALVGVPLLAVVLRLLAPLFAARSGFSGAMRVTAYAYTPAWLAGILLAYPPVRSLQLAAVAYAL